MGVHSDDYLVVYLYTKYQGRFTITSKRICVTLLDIYKLLLTKVTSIIKIHNKSPATYSKPHRVLPVKNNQ